MGGGGLTILDGSSLLREADLSLPDTVITVAEVLELAETRASVSLHGLELPETLKCAALRRLGVSDAAAFRTKDLGCSDAASTLRNYVSAIADELRDDPIVVAILDGRTLQMFLSDEDDFAMLAENLFTDLDIEDKGKISKDEIQNPLIHMGIESGIPPISEFPQLRDIVKKHGAEGKEEVGQAEFAQLLQNVLQELADTLAKKPVVVIQHILVVNGSKLRKLLADEKLLNDVAEKIMQEKHESKSQSSRALKIRYYLEEHWDDLCLPSLELDETPPLFDEIFTEIESQNQNDAVESGKDGFVLVLRKILEKFAVKLEANPILHDLQPSKWIEV